MQTRKSSTANATVHHLIEPFTRRDSEAAIGYTTELHAVEYFFNDQSIAPTVFKEINVAKRSFERKTLTRVTVDPVYKT
jgi:hypothetical protein